MIDVSTAKLTGKILDTVQPQCGNSTYLHKCPHGCLCALNRCLHKPKTMCGVRLTSRTLKKGGKERGRGRDKAGTGSNRDAGSHRNK